MAHEDTSSASETFGAPIELGHPTTAWKVNDLVTVWWDGLVRVAGDDRELRDYFTSDHVGIDDVTERATDPKTPTFRAIQSEQDLGLAMSENLYGPIWTFDKIEGFRPPHPGLAVHRDADRRLLAPEGDAREVALRVKSAFQAFHERDDPTGLKAFGIIPKYWDQDVHGQPPR